MFYAIQTENNTKNKKQLYTDMKTKTTKRLAEQQIQAPSA